MLEPGMRDEERKGRKIRKVVVGEEDLKRRAEEGEGVEVSGAGCGAGQPD